MCIRDSSNTDVEVDGVLEVLSSDKDSYKLTFVGEDVNGNDVNLEFEGSVDYSLGESFGFKGADADKPKTIFGKRK